MLASSSQKIFTYVFSNFLNFSFGKIQFVFFNTTSQAFFKSCKTCLVKIWSKWEQQRTTFPLWLPYLQPVQYNFSQHFYFLPVNLQLRPIVTETPHKLFRMSNKQLAPAKCAFAKVFRRGLSAFPVESGVAFRAVGTEDARLKAWERVLITSCRSGLAPMPFGWSRLGCVQQVITVNLLPARFMHTDFLSHEIHKAVWVKIFIKII